MDDPLFKDETPEEEREYKSYDYEHEETKRRIAVILNIVSIFLLFVYPYICYSKGNISKYFFLSLITGMITATVAVKLNPQSILSKIILIAGILLIIFLVIAFIYVVNMLINDCINCFGCAGSNMP